MDTSEISSTSFKVFIAMSLDGFIADQDGGLSFLDCVQMDGEDCGFKDFFKSIDTIVLGRNTYETVASFPDWPYSEKRVIVLSRTLKKVREGVELYSGDIKQLKIDGHAWIDGGKTISHFLKSNLIDELTVSIVPILLGKGIPLFHQMDRSIKCRLKETKYYPTGLVQVSYDLDRND